MKSQRIWVLLCMSIAWIPVHAIVVRGDAPAEAALSEPAEFPAVVSLLDGRAVGTVIADEWILTAAHVAAAVNTDSIVAIDGQTRRIVEVVLHPSWDAERVGQPGVTDLGLLRLNAPLRPSPAVVPYRGCQELGMVIDIVGWGRTGDGRDPVLVKDHQFRRGQNRITALAPRLRFRFDSPESGNALPLEAVSGPGDSGGPAFVMRNGALYLVGVSSFQQDEASPGLYGVIENYERVSDHVHWIDTVTDVPTAIPP
jgi:hypothetical protein